MVAYGITARSARRAVDLGRSKGLALGLFRPVSVWPFPAEKLTSHKNVTRIVVAEINMGQVALEVERIAGSYAEVVHVGNPGGSIIAPETILEACTRPPRARP